MSILVDLLEAIENGKKVDVKLKLFGKSYDVEDLFNKLYEPLVDFPYIIEMERKKSMQAGFSYEIEEAESRYRLWFDKLRKNIPHLVIKARLPKETKIWEGKVYLRNPSEMFKFPRYVKKVPSTVFVVIEDLDNLHLILSERYDSRNNSPYAKILSHGQTRLDLDRLLGNTQFQEGEITGGLLTLPFFAKYDIAPLRIALPSIYYSKVRKGYSALILRFPEALLSKELITQLGNEIISNAINRMINIFYKHKFFIEDISSEQILYEHGNFKVHDDEFVKIFNTKSKSRKSVYRKIEYCIKDSLLYDELKSWQIDIQTNNKKIDSNSSLYDELIDFLEHNRRERKEDIYYSLVYLNNKIVRENLKRYTS